MKVGIRPQSARARNDNLPSGLTNSQILQKINEARDDRKKVEEEAKILENRVKLLKIEEAKANKIIEDTKKKMQDMIDVKLKKQEKIQLHEQEKLKRLKESQDKLEMNKKIREMNKFKVEASKENNQIKIKSQAQDVIRDLIEQRMIANRKNNVEMKKKLDSIMNIKVHEKNLSTKKVKIEQNKFDLCQQNHQTQVQFELERKQRKMAEIANLEQQEAELIKRLQTTQKNQLNIYESYEKLRTTDSKELLNESNKKGNGFIKEILNNSNKKSKPIRPNSAAMEARMKSL